MSAQARARVRSCAFRLCAQRWRAQNARADQVFGLAWCGASALRITVQLVSDLLASRSETHVVRFSLSLCARPRVCLCLNYFFSLFIV